MKIKITYNLVSLLSVIFIAIIVFACEDKERNLPTPKPCKDQPTITHLGKTYNTVAIDKYCWMAENLNIGSFIPSSQPMRDNGIVEKYCYDNDTANCNIYGGLYTWDEIMNYTTFEGAQGICPDGWHLPAFDEWESLSIYLGYDYGAQYLKGNEQDLWKEPNYGMGNETGFSALPGGTLFQDSVSFSNLSEDSYFWTSSELDANFAWNRSMNYASVIFREFATSKKNARSVRCIKDQ